MRNFTYQGRRTGNRRIVLVLDEKKQAIALPIKPSQDVYNHSSEFEWGYGGSGPTQLALAILLHHIGETPLEERLVSDTAPGTAVRLYQEFKFDVVTGWNGDEWKITTAEIQNWIRTKTAQAETKRKDYSHSPEFPKDLVPPGNTSSIIHG